MKSKLAVGRKWAYLEVIGESTEEVESQTSEDGSCSITEKLPCWKLRCACGVEFTLLKREWYGVRYFKDCGCGISFKDGNTVIITASVPARIKIEVSKYAAKNQLSFSRALWGLLDKQLGVEGAENKTNDE